MSNANNKNTVQEWFKDNSRAVQEQPKDTGKASQQTYEHTARATNYQRHPADAASAELNHLTLKDDDASPLLLLGL